MWLCRRVSSLCKKSKLRKLCDCCIYVYTICGLPYAKVNSKWIPLLIQYKQQYVTFVLFISSKYNVDQAKYQMAQYSDMGADSMHPVSQNI